MTSLLDAKTPPPDGVTVAQSRKATATKPRTGASSETKLRNRQGMLHFYASAT